MEEQGSLEASMGGFRLVGSSRAPGRPAEGWCRPKGRERSWAPERPEGEGWGHSKQWEQPCSSPLVGKLTCFPASLYFCFSYSLPLGLQRPLSSSCFPCFHQVCAVQDLERPLVNDLQPKLKNLINFTVGLGRVGGVNEVGSRTGWTTTCKQ